VSIELSARRLRILTFLLAVASGATIANIFYSQPLLGLIGSSFGISESAAYRNIKWCENTLARNRLAAGRYR